MFNVCATVCNRDGSVYLNSMPSVLQMVYLTEPYHEIICFMARITNVRNHFILDLFKKTKLFGFNACTVTSSSASVTSFAAGRRKRGYLHPREHSKLPYVHISRGRHTRIQVSGLNLNLVIPPFYHDSTTKNMRFYSCKHCEFSPSLLRLFRWRPCWEEGNCRYLRSLSHLPRVGTILCFGRKLECVARLIHFYIICLMLNTFLCLK